MKKDTYLIGSIEEDIMLGLKSKDIDITLKQLNNYLNSDSKELMGVRLDTSYTSNLMCEPVLIGASVDGSSFITDIIVKPDIAQHQMVKDLNTSLHDTGLGFVITDKENPLMADSTVDTLFSRIEQFEGVYTSPDYLVRLGFYEPHELKRTTLSLSKGLKIDIIKIYINVDDIKYTLYLAFSDYHYDGQTMLGLLSKYEYTRLDTLKLFSLMSSNNIFGDPIISAIYKNDRVSNLIYDTTHMGMGILIPDLNELENYPKFVVNSGESEIYLNHKDILNSKIVAINKKEHKYKMVVNLKKGDTLEIIFD